MLLFSKFRNTLLALTTSVLLLLVFATAPSHGDETQPFDWAGKRNVTLLDLALVKMQNDLRYLQKPDSLLSFESYVLYKAQPGKIIFSVELASPPSQQKEQMFNRRICEQKWLQISRIFGGIGSGPKGNRNNPAFYKDVYIDAISRYFWTMDLETQELPDRFYERIIDSIEINVVQLHPIPKLCTGHLVDQKPSQFLGL